MAGKPPSQISGQAPAPSANQKRKPKKPKIVKAAQSVGDRVVGAIESLNPFD